MILFPTFIDKYLFFFSKKISKILSIFSQKTFYPDSFILLFIVSNLHVYAFILKKFFVVGLIYFLINFNCSPNDLQNPNIYD